MRRVSRENSGDQGGIRPDIPGRRDLDPQFVEDRPDPTINNPRGVK